jgi:hypothetical protein
VLYPATDRNIAFSGIPGMESLEEVIKKNEPMVEVKGM